MSVSCHRTNTCITGKASEIFLHSFLSTCSYSSSFLTVQELRKDWGKGMCSASSHPPPPTPATRSDFGKDISCQAEDFCSSYAHTHFQLCAVPGIAFSLGPRDRKGKVKPGTSDKQPERVSVLSANGLREQHSHRNSHGEQVSSHQFSPARLQCAHGMASHLILV